MARTGDKLHFGLTDAGRVILRGVVFVGLAALLVPAFDVLSVLVCVLLVASAVGFVFRPRVLVTGSLPERIVAGQVAQVTYTIRNVGRLPAYYLRLWFRTLPESIESVGEARTTERLGPGETSEVTLALRPGRRGTYAIEPPLCESTFPFNLFHFGRFRRGAESLVVLPAFSLLEVALPYRSRHVNVSSLRPAGRVGSSPEYIGNRPFQPGDPPRRIDVRAWARLAVPVTKEYDDDLDNYAALVLDTRCLGQGEDRSAGRGRGGSLLSRWTRLGRGHPGREPLAVSSEELEAAVSLCASMAYTIHRDCLIDLLLAGPDLHVFTSMPKTLRLDRIQETLAVVQPSCGYATEQIGPLLEERWGEISEVIFILLRWDDTYQRLAQQAEQAGCHCTVFMVGEAEPSECGVRSAECGLKEADSSNPQSALRNPQWTVGAAGDVRFVAAEEILAGRRDLP